MSWQLFRKLRLAKNRVMELLNRFENVYGTPGRIDPPQVDSILSLGGRQEANDMLLLLGWG